MGKDKATLPLDGTAMALAVAARYACLGPVAFAVDRAGRFPSGGRREFQDEFPGKGPLNGIVSAFSQTDEDVVLLTATDMPLGSAQSAKILLRQLPGHDACLFRRQPLFGVYARSCLEPARACLREGKLSFRDLFARVDARVLEAEDEAEFLNLNTPEEYQKFITTGGVS